MNYLEPGDVVDAVVEKLKLHKADITFKNKHIKSIREIAEMPDTNENGMTPPWLGVFYNLEDGGDSLSDGSVYHLPVTIGVLCSSTPSKISETKALREAMAFSRQIVKYIKGVYNINIGTEETPEIINVVLKAKTQPREIIQASSELSLVVTKFQYLDIIS